MFTGNGTGLIATITFFANGVATVFTSLDSVQFFDAPFSILDIFISILLFRLVSWYILRIITGKEQEEKAKAYETKGMNMESSGEE